MSDADNGTPRIGGAIAWMARNPVTANLLMIFLIGGGLFTTTRIKKEVFPSFALDTVTVTVAFPGASPEEVERGIIMPIEEAVRGLEDIKDIQGLASEGQGRAVIEMVPGGDQDRVYQDIDQAIARIRTFPDEAEEPIVERSTRSRAVFSLRIAGDVSEATLLSLTQSIRDRLLADPEITQVDLLGTRDVEVHIEVAQSALREHDLTLDEIAQRIARSSVELPAGRIETQGGEILLRTTDRRDWAREFSTIPIKNTQSGATISLGDITSRVSEGFADVNMSSQTNRKRALTLAVFRVGEQTPITVGDAVRRIMTEIEPGFPPTVEWSINNDRSVRYKERQALLLKNAFMGLVLVMALLGLLLELRLAFWVTMGIPTSFLGAVLFLPVLDVSINIISMFAFIVALGIVVDDAIIAGENIYECRKRGMNNLQAAIVGAKQVAKPISFAILTNIVCFMPLYFAPGTLGKIWRHIPLVVVSTFVISWVEALFILPAHLSHERAHREHRERWFSTLVDRFVLRIYRPVLDLCLRWRGITIAIGIATLVIAFSYAKSGRVGVIFLPRVEGDIASATAMLPLGSPESRVEKVRDLLVDAAYAVTDANGGEELRRSIVADITENGVNVFINLAGPEERKISTTKVSELWREELGQVPEATFVRFASDFGGPGSGPGLSIELRHSNIESLDRASALLAERLAEFPNVKDIDDGYEPGKRQLDFQLKDAGASLGLTSSDIARQVRDSFYGAEVLRQQRERDEVRVLVRLPEAERSSEKDIENLLIRAPSGRWVPLYEVATVTRGRAFTSITRRNARRAVMVTANVVPIGQTGQVRATLDQSILPELARDIPGLAYSYEGRQADRRESFSGVTIGFLVALVVVYFLLAVPFKSYSQPLIIMIAIPFGAVGALIGHVVMGFNLSILSMMGFVALTGVVINDSLVLVEYANSRRAEGLSPTRAIRSAGLRRFRPVLLTTMTTFLGLAPLILEESSQARFLVPMALSLGFGILFATVVTLVLVPCLYSLLEELKQLARRGD